MKHELIYIDIYINLYLCIYIYIYIYLNKTSRVYKRQESHRMMSTFNGPGEDYVKRSMESFTYLVFLLKIAR